MDRKDKLDVGKVQTSQMLCVEMAGLKPKGDEIHPIPDRIRVKGFQTLDLTIKGLRCFL